MGPFIFFWAVGGNVCSIFNKCGTISFTVRQAEQSACIKLPCINWKYVSKRTGSLEMCGVTLWSAPAKIRSHCVVCVLQLAISDCTSLSVCHFHALIHWAQAVFDVQPCEYFVGQTDCRQLTHKFSMSLMPHQKESWKKLYFFALSVMSSWSCKDNVTKLDFECCSLFFCGRWVF